MVGDSLLKIYVCASPKTLHDIIVAIVVLASFQFSSSLLLSTSQSAISNSKPKINSSPEHTLQARVEITRSSTSPSIEFEDSAPRRAYTFNRRFGAYEGEKPRNTPSSSAHFSTSSLVQMTLFRLKSSAPETVSYPKTFFCQERRTLLPRAFSLPFACNLLVEYQLLA